MKILLSWLNDYIETGLKAEQIAEILSNLGFPCEGIVSLENDALLDIEVTSNRGDCLSYIGIARELSAFTGKELKMPVIEIEETEKDVAELADVDILEPDLCSRYTARVIQDIKVGPSPQWLKDRIEAVGMRSVNNVVDATNYAMLETGQPPHAFDYHKIREGKIFVRKAVPGERIVSIDGSKCELDTQMLIIADPRGPVAVAGVMGGLETEVSDTTKTILLEDAHFDPVSVRNTSRKLSLPSEAAFRFERMIDIEKVDWASKRTAQLITQAAGGKVLKGVVDAYPKKLQPRKVTLRLSRLNKLLGIEVSSERAETILSSLDFKPQLKDDLLLCSAPSWRNDIYREADLIEEVARVYGYDNIPTEKRIQIEVVPAEPYWKLIQSVSTYLCGSGFYECVSITFVDEEIAQLFVPSDTARHLAVKDAAVKGKNLLRRTLLGSLFGLLKTNLNAGNSPCCLFEIANTYEHANSNAPLPDEKTRLTLVSDSDLRGLRGVIEGLINTLDPDAEVIFQPSKLPWAEVSADIVVDRKLIGTMGIVNEDIRGKLDFKDTQPIGAELDFDSLAQLQSDEIQVKPIPRFPAIERDLSVIIEESVCWDDIINAVKSCASDKLKDISYIDTYYGKGIPSGKKSVTLSLQFRDEDGTLTHETVDDFEKAIVKNLGKSIDAELRTI
ncbi:MAG: phenylalanine--tRNA ligase subunit beta [Planctomycetota bacterium]|jgi:phenylalanyl-tRNA synthetase beta chain